MTSRVTNIDELKAALYEDFNDTRERADNTNCFLVEGKAAFGQLRQAEAQIAASIIAIAAQEEPGRIVWPKPRPGHAIPIIE